MARILVVDDDDQFRAMLRKILQRAGHEVIEAVNGRDGIREFRSKPTDLVITDILMPVMSGTRLISDLRADYPRLKIIALSGGGSLHRSGDYLSFAKELGAQRIVAKPVDREELVRIVGELLPLPISDE